MTLRLSVGAHEAHLDVLAGCGLLVLPRLEDGLPEMDSGSTVTLADGEVATTCDTLHEADVRSMIRLLDSHGWEIDEDEWGQMLVEGVRPDSRIVVSLFGREPVVDEVPLDLLAEASGRLLEAVGLAG